MTPPNRQSGTPYPSFARMLLRILALPIALVFLVERVFFDTCGKNWYRAGANIATCFISTLVHALMDVRPGPGRAWVRIVAHILAWFAAFAGLAWFFLGGWWAFLLIPLLRQGHRLDRAPLEAPEPDWTTKPLLFRLETLDYVSLAVMFGVALFVVVLRHNLHIMPPDSYYHMQVARSIVENGRIPTHDDWSFAPYGRPHLYPPLFHLLIAAVSLPFGGNIVESMLLLQAIWPLLLYFSTWYGARLLFDARRAFLAFLIVGSCPDVMDVTFRTLPSILANDFSLFMLVFFLKRRIVSASILATLGLYVHSGITPLVLVGLAIFSLTQRTYLVPFLAMLALSLLAYSPWGWHVMRHGDAFSVPGEPGKEGLLAVLLDPFTKVFWLLNVSLVVGLLATRGLKLAKWNELRNRLLATQLVAFLPMLIEYGGRFFMHTASIWGMFAAIPMVRFLDPPLSKKRIGLFLLLALSPTLLFGGLDIDPGPPKFGPLGFAPMVSAWILQPAGVSGIREIKEGWFYDYVIRHHVYMYPQAKGVGAYIKARTKPDQIVYAFGDLDTEIRIAFMADRRMRSGAWQEVRGTPEDMRKLKEIRDKDPNGIYVTMDEANKSLVPSTIQWVKVLRVHVGLPSHAVIE